MIRTQYKQEIRGNPGDCYIACLLYVLKEKYGITTSVEIQKDIFVKGILNARLTYFVGSLNEIVRRFGRPVSVYISDKYQTQAALREISDRELSVSTADLNIDFLKNLIDEKQFVTFSVDRYLFYPYYHDYFFATASKKDDGFKIMEPFSGKIRCIGNSELNELLYSTRKYLDDSAVAMTV